MSPTTTTKPVLMIYGSYGYTGSLIAQHAIERGLTPVLAGRSEAALTIQAAQLGLEYRVFDLDDRGPARAALADVTVVMHCAGPFSLTSRTMVEHCLATSTHYLDITGEVPVFEALAEFDDAARAAGVMLLGGVGFDVVPTDCLAAHLQRRMPDATSLELGFHLVDNGAPTRGTQHTIVEGIMQGGLVRQDGVITRVPSAWKTQRINFGDGPQLATTIPWGDVSTAFHSTGIPNVEVYMGVTRSMLVAQRSARLIAPLLRIRLVHRLVAALIRRQSAGPDASTRAISQSIIWGRVRNEHGATMSSMLRAPGTYPLTAHTAVEIIKRTLDGDARPGFQTPSRLYGPDFIMEIDGVERIDDAVSPELVTA